MASQVFDREEGLILSFNNHTDLLTLGACGRIMVVILSVCLSVCVSDTELAATYLAYTLKVGYH